VPVERPYGGKPSGIRRTIRRADADVGARGIVDTGLATPSRPGEKLGSGGGLRLSAPGNDLVSSDFAFSRAGWAREYCGGVEVVA
jgi:hypothetical protein